MIRTNIKKTIMFAIAAMTWFALVLQMYVLVSNTPGNGMTPIEIIEWVFIFFTILSNILVAICITTLLLNPYSEMGGLQQITCYCSGGFIYFYCRISLQCYPAQSLAPDKSAKISR
jgi:hypothetical protein